MSAADFKLHQNLCIILVRTRNPLNIGAVARAMANFGRTQLRLVAPYDLAFREARSAVGASELLANAEVCQSVAEAGRQPRVCRVPTCCPIGALVDTLSISKVECAGSSGV